MVGSPRAEEIDRGAVEQEGCSSTLGKFKVKISFPQNSGVTHILIGRVEGTVRVAGPETVCVVRIVPELIIDDERTDIVDCRFTMSSVRSTPPEASVERVDALVRLYTGILSRCCPPKIEPPGRGQANHAARSLWVREEQ